jgi:hypothetical protein
MPISFARHDDDFFILLWKNFDSIHAKSTTVPTILLI